MTLAAQSKLKGAGGKLTVCPRQLQTQGRGLSGVELSVSFPLVPTEALTLGQPHLMPRKGLYCSYRNKRFGDTKTMPSHVTLGSPNLNGLKKQRTGATSHWRLNGRQNLLRDGRATGWEPSLALTVGDDTYPRLILAQSHSVSVPQVPSE